nr:MAG TPA: hypothetical protein [Caudoviricetes sp.]
MALYRGTEHFSLARTFRTAWGGQDGDIVRRFSLVFTFVRIA